MIHISKLADYLVEDRILVTEEVAGKKDIIRGLLSILCGADKEVCDNQEEIYTAIWDREQEKSTGVGKEVAIPHGRSACLSNIYIAFAKVKKGLDWYSPDNKPVKFVFLVIGPKKAKVEEYLNILAQVSKLISRQETRQELQEADSKEQITEVIKGLRERKDHAD